MSECEHDWRVDPHVVLPTWPPQARLVCAKCAATRGSGIETLPKEMTSHDPRDWPKWEKP